MKVSKEHHVDASEPREDGGYDWYYAYTLHTFETDERQMVARQYDDESCATFLRHAARRKRPRGWRAARSFETVPYDDALFVAAAKHLVDVEAIRAVLVNAPSGPTPVDLSRLG